MMTLVEFLATITDMPELNEAELAMLPHLVETALKLRRAGVRPRLEQLAVSRLELEAWLVSGHRFEIERAQRTGLAAQGPRGIALAQAELDGGAAADEMLLDLAARELGRRGGPDEGV